MRAAAIIAKNVNEIAPTEDVAARGAPDYMFTADRFGSRQLSVRSDARGYYVALLFRSSGDDLYETITHSHRFASQGAAARLAERVKASGFAVDLRYWDWLPSQAAAYAFMQKPNPWKGPRAA